MVVPRVQPQNNIPYMVIWWKVLIYNTQLWFIVSLKLELPFAWASYIYSKETILDIVLDIMLDLKN